MPYDATTGIYARPANSFSNPVAGQVIDPTDADSLFDDFETVFNKTKTTYVSTLHTNSTTTPTEVTSLQQTLVAGAYRFSYFLICQTSNTADGLTFAVNYTGTVTTMTAMLTYPDANALASTGQVDDVANAAAAQLVGHSVTKTKNTTTPTLSTGTGGATTADSNLFIKIEGVIVVSDGGDFELWHGSESTNATRVEVGSNLLMIRVA